MQISVQYINITRNILCIISFFSAFLVLSRKFELLFGQSAHTAHLRISVIIISSPLAEFCSSSYINSLLSFTHFIMAFSLLFPLFYVHPLPFLPHSFILIYSIFPSLSPLASLHPNLLYLPFLIPSSIIHPNLQYLPFRAGNSLIGFLSKSLVFCKKVSEWSICSFAHFLWANGRSLLVSDLSNSLTLLIFGERPERFALTLLTKNEGMSELLI